MADDVNHTDEESALTRRLGAAAASVSARPDLAEVELGAGRVRSRRRLLTGVAAAMLIAGAGGIGFGIGRSVSEDAEQMVADQSATQEAEPVTNESATTLPATTVPGTAAPTPAPTTTLPTPSTGDSDGAASDPASSYWTPTPMDLLHERTLPSGIRVRLQVGQSFETGWYEGEWRPAAYCFADREARITVDGPDIVDVGGVALYSEVFAGLQVQPGEVGWADDHPVRYLVVQADPAVTEVAVAWDDGLTDRVGVSNGVAVLVVESAASDPDGAWIRDYVLEVTEATGVRTVTRDDLNHYEDPDYRAGCSPPPPALPDPGEQPADAAAAEQALRDRFALLWDQSVPRDDKRTVLDDWTGVDAAAEAVLVGDFADAAATAEHAIEEIVFTSPTEAWFRYALLTDISDFYERYGTAALVDGEWQFARAVMCQDLSLGGGSCEPGFEPIYPPSWYERSSESCWETEEGTMCEAVDVPVVTTIVP